MVNYQLQLNNQEEQNKTLDELVRESFSGSKPKIDLSFFYDQRSNKEHLDFPKKKPSHKH